MSVKIYAQFESTSSGESIIQGIGFAITLGVDSKITDMVDAALKIANIEKEYQAAHIGIYDQDYQNYVHVDLSDPVVHIGKYKIIVQKLFPDPAPISDLIENGEYVKPWMFYILEENGLKSATISIDKRFATTFRHKTHKKYCRGLQITVYSSANDQAFEMMVVYISETMDFVLLKCLDYEQDLVKIAPKIVESKEGETFIVCGYADGSPELTYVEGRIHTKKPFYYFSSGIGNRNYFSSGIGNGITMGPFVQGTAKIKLGDSGGGCFSKSGLIGMNISLTNLPLTPHNEIISKASTFSSTNAMVSASSLQDSKTEFISKNELDKYCIIELEDV